MADVRKHMIFHGRVQGVGFRYTAKYLARSMNLTGKRSNDLRTDERTEQESVYPDRLDRYRREGNRNGKQF